jgi:hypothetical protein
LNGQTLRRSIATVLTLVTAVAAAGVVAAPEAAAYLPHATLVPETPATGYPRILKTDPLDANARKQVYAAEQVGRYIVAGGDFVQIELADDTIIDQKFFATWNIDTKQMVCQQQFVFDNEVLAFAPGPTATTVYVVGRFAKVTGADGVQRTRGKVALLDLSNCSVNTTFVSTGANGKIDEVVNIGGRIFVGGDFTSIGGAAIETIAELNGVNGAVNTAFNFVTTNESVSRIKALGTNAASTRLLVGGRFGTISRNGVSIPAPTAVIDITDPAAPVLTAHRSSGYVTILDMQDVGIAPDGSSFGLVFGTATSSDYVYLTASTEAPVSYTWRHFMRDSSFGVAVTETAVYVGGHFCKPDDGPGTAELMEPKMGLDDCTGTRNYTGGVWRTHLAALSLTDGTPLAWNPGQDSFLGAQRLVATTRGLLVGFDGERVNGIRTGALAFFDFGAAIEDQTPPSDVTFTAPTAGESVNNPATISGTATDNFGIVRYALTVQANDGRYLQPDGSLDVEIATFTIPADAAGGFSIDLMMPAGNYNARARAYDTAGLRSVNSTEVSFTETGLETLAPDITIAAPVGSVEREVAIAVTGTATDNVAVASLVVQVRNAAGLYLQPDHTLAAGVADVPVTITSGALGTTSANWAIDLGATLPVDTYTVEATATDPSANTRTVSATVTVTANSPVPPVVTIISPATSVNYELAVQIAGAVTDNLAVGAVQVQLQNAADLYLQGDGTFAATPTDLPATINGLGTNAASFAFDAGRLPTGSYRVTIRATDLIDNVTVSTRDVAITDRIFIVSPAITTYAGFRTTDDNAMMGYTFRVNQSVDVAALGIFDANRDGRLNNPSAANIGLWQQSNQALLASTSIPTTAAAEGGWFYANLTAPVTLQPGVVYVVGHQTFRRGEPYARDGSITSNAQFVFLQRATRSTSTFSYPNSQGAGVGYGMPNMKLVQEVSPNPTVTVGGPAASITFGQDAVVTGSAADNGQIAQITVRVRNAAGNYLQADGGFAAGAHDLATATAGVGTAAATFDTPVGQLPTGSYTASVIAVDGVGNSTSADRTFQVVVPPTTALAISGYSGFNTSGADTTAGYTFQVAQVTKVSAIGILDSNGDGRLNNQSSAAVGLWQQSTQTLLGSSSVPTNAVSEGGWFYGNLAAPVTLQPGVVYVVGHQTFKKGERYASNGSLATHSQFTYLTRATRSGTTFGYPSTQSNGVGYGVPNLKISLPAAPIVARPADRTTAIGAPTTLSLIALDPDGGAVTFSAASLPDGLSLDANTGVISGTPTTPGAIAVTVTVTDDEGATASTNFLWTIT